MRAWRQQRNSYRLCAPVAAAHEPVVRLRRAGHQVSAPADGLARGGAGRSGGVFRLNRAAWSD